MANEEQLERIREGVDVWNAWRKEKYDEIKEPDLRGADLSGAKLHKANLFGAILYKSKLIGADLREANLRGASLIEADLTNADLSGADLRWAQIIGTTLFDATLTGSRVYGVSVWDIKVNHLTKQQNLIITDRVKVNHLTKQQNSIKTDPGEPEITVDDIKVAQFIHLLLEHQEIRNVIDTITSKAVLILGRFGGGGIEVLREVAEALRKRKYLPIIFDFKRPTDLSFTGTVQTLVGLSRFGEYAEDQVLKWEDVDWQKHLITVRHEVGKQTSRKMGNRPFSHRWEGSAQATHKPLSQASLADSTGRSAWVRS